MNVMPPLTFFGGSPGGLIGAMMPAQTAVYFGAG
jgi:hypothetical protein